MNYRNPKLLKLADGAPCMMCSMQDGTVVSAHSNQLRDGKGTGIKGSVFNIFKIYFNGAEPFLSGFHELLLRIP